MVSTHVAISSDIISKFQKFEIFSQPETLQPYIILNV